MTVCVNQGFWNSCIMRIAAGFMNEIPVTGKYHREWQNDILNSFPRTFFVVSQYFANFSAGVSHHSLHSVWPLSPWELIINYILWYSLFFFEYFLFLFQPAFRIIDCALCDHFPLESWLSITGCFFFDWSALKND